MSPRPPRIALAVLLLPVLLAGCDAMYDDTKGWANRLEASLLSLGDEAGEPSAEAAPEAAPAPKGMQAPPAVPVEPVAVASLPESAAAPAVRQPQPAPAAAETAAPEGLLAAASAALLAPAPDAEAATDGKKEDKKEEPATALPPVPKAKPAVPAGPAEAAGDAVVAAVLHLSSLRSEEAAERQWSDLQRSYPEPLGRLQAQIRRTELGEKGTFYRVLAGPLPSRDAASQVCAALKAKDSQQYCRVLAAEPKA